MAVFGLETDECRVIKDQQFPACKVRNNCGTRVKIKQLVQPFENAPSERVYTRQSGLHGREKDNQVRLGKAPFPNHLGLGVTI